MAEINGFAPPDVGTEEHIIRRLGWAIVRQWPSLPESVKDRIREPAIFIVDTHATAQLNEQIKAFISKHSVASDAQRS